MDFHFTLVANADTIFYFERIYQRNQQLLDKLSNSFCLNESVTTVLGG